MTSRLYGAVQIFFTFSKQFSFSLDSTFIYIKIFILLSSDIFKLSDAKFEGNVHRSKGLMKGSWSHKTTLWMQVYLCGADLLTAHVHTCCLYTGRKEKALLHLIHIYSYSTWCNYTCCVIHQNRTVRLYSARSMYKMFP